MECVSIEYLQVYDTNGGKKYSLTCQTKGENPMRKQMYKTVLILSAVSSILWAATPATAILEQATIISGLKEALAISTEKAIAMVGKTDGYFGNKMIKILMPGKMQMVADALGKAGMQKQIDEFILSMNRAAEKAAPKAASIFGDAIKNMNLEDAQKILNGGDTAATDYFQLKTSDSIYNEFKPIIAATMEEMGTTRLFENIMGKAKTLPFMSKTTVDLDDYVTKKATSGLFLMLGQQEKMIRVNPGARSTDLLKKVFAQ